MPQPFWIRTMQQERLIRKYSNRRLYDTGGSRHVTLEDLRQLIVAGEKIKVIDDKSGEDLTRSVLLQIISEQEQFGLPVLGSELLEMIIRFYGGPMQALLSRYLEQAFTTMVRQQEAMQSEMSKALQTPFAPLTELARKNMEMWEQMQAATRNAFGASTVSTASSEPSAPSAPSAQSSQSAPRAKPAKAANRNADKPHNNPKKGK
jgi:polyhydroxyalkanoate synthesis repressor PhaR